MSIEWPEKVKEGHEGGVVPTVTVSQKDDKKKKGKLNLDLDLDF